MSAEGLAVIIGYETDEDINRDIDDGLYDAVNELMGDAEGDLKKAQPFLSALGPLLSSFGGGSDADKKKAEEEAEAAKKEEEKQAAANKKTTLYVVLGLAGAAVLGFGGYLVSRKK